MEWHAPGGVAARDMAERGGFVPRAPTIAADYRVAFRRREERLIRRAAMIMRLLASTAAPTNNAKRSAPSARQRFMPRPRISTEMRPSMPARKRWPCLNGADFWHAELHAVPLGARARPARPLTSSVSPTAAGSRGALSRHGADKHTATALGVSPYHQQPPPMSTG